MFTIIFAIMGWKRENNVGGCDKGQGTTPNQLKSKLVSLLLQRNILFKKLHSWINYN